MSECALSRIKTLYLKQILNNLKKKLLKSEISLTKKCQETVDIKAMFMGIL